MPRPKRTSERVPPGTYERLVQEHGSEACWICGTAPKTRRLHIDHDHIADPFAERPRGLLCYACNKILLPTWITPERLRAAADYLEARQP